MCKGKKSYDAIYIYVFVWELVSKIQFNQGNKDIVG